MSLWFFGRRGGKAAKLKEGRLVADAEGKHPGAADHAPDVARSASLRKTNSRRRGRRRRSGSRSTTDSMHNVEKHPPAAPFEKDSPRPRRRSSTEDITALPISKRLEQSPHLRHVTNEHGIPYNFQTGSQSSLARERGKLQRPQSLRKPPTSESISLIRRKSSKRREHDAVREEEIRAMTMPLPQKRPAGNSGGMLRRDSKKVKGGLNRHFERPTSNISLPLEDSIHSSMSSSSETRAFRVSALDMFSPRPKIRCSVGSQYYYNSNARTSPTSRHGRDESRPDHRMATNWESKEDKRTSRIDDLADTLDAGALRDILERDKKRREKKRKADDERLRRRLERRAEKQRAAEQGGTPATPRRDARGAIGLGIEKETSTPMEDVRPSTPPQVQRPEGVPPPALSTYQNSQLPTPLDSPVEEPVVADAQEVRYSRASPSPQTHTRGPSNVSEMPALLSEMISQDTPVQSVEPVQDPSASGSLHPVVTTDTAATPKKGIARRRSSEGRRIGVFASLFRRGKRNSQDQARATPSEVSFSNTSRESMSRQPLPAHLVAPTQPIQIRRPSSSVPHRTMSKFREDLPEFREDHLPLSPPDSRVQSPEVPSGSAIAARRRSQQPSDLRVTSGSPAPGYRTDSPVSPGIPPAGLMSQSLASVDSEASWLSGKPMQRRSNKSYLRSSVGSASAIKRNEEFNASYEELGIPDDEYFQRLTPQPDDRRRSANSAELLARKASSTAMATETGGDFDEEITVGETNSDDELVKTVGRQPTIVHRQARVKSTEGLLSYFAPEPTPGDEKPAMIPADDAPEQESPTSESEPVVLQRAKSIDIGKHHSRQLSAGSAKLLDIPARRSSVDPKRSSTGSRSVLTDQ
ncbi:hypothetical protein K491DRAFT_422640 [Lophiostoma macrostomum CBS 122681]|uniref:Uncharacterized protein n=1 Tax=Lophiostoma macrostomum CBS 122681 TaxID=1314788 RepID=A0A6A6T6C5_9PLEO|nr:hypothetical protein K491DRAFT_422640 [Lophiostoma macrostomum CBS 122681]